MREVSSSALADFETHRIEGFVHQTGQPLCVPLFTQIDGNLWMGGAPVESLPREFKFCVDLYTHADYHVGAGQTRVQHFLQDSRSQPIDVGLLDVLSAFINAARKLGPVLVHCQAGLNRSGLVTAHALRQAGWTVQDAINTMRAKRDPQVLCNTKFEGWLRGEIPPGHNPEAWA